MVKKSDKPERESIYRISIPLTRSAYRALCINAANSKPLTKAHKLGAQIIEQAMLKKGKI